MISRGQKHMKQLLSVVSKIYNIPLFEEIKEGNKRYDFYFPTNPPLIFEVNGKQHKYNQADGFFFKTTEALLKYKKNDLERKVYNKTGSILLLEFDDDEFPSLNEILKTLEEHDAIKILEKGVDTYNAYYESYRYNKEQEGRRKEQAREFRKKISKQRNDFRNRFK